MSDFFQKLKALPFPLGVLLLSGQLSAATLIWDNNAATPPNPQDGSGTWNLSNLNWWDASTSSHSAWNNDAYDTAEFNGSGTSTSNVTFSGTLFKVGGLVFTSAVAPASSGNSHSFSGSSTVLELASGGIIDARTNSRANLSESVSFRATGGFTKTGAGVFIIRKTDGIIGETIVNQGSLDLYNTARFSKLTVEADGNLITHSANNLTFDELIYDSSKDSALASLTTNSTFTIGAGGLTIRRSSLRLTADSTTAKLVLKGNITMDSENATASISTGGSGTLAEQRLIDFDGGIRDITVANGSRLSLHAVVQNGGFVKKGTGTLELRGPNNFSQGLSIEEGVVVMNTSAARLADGTAELNIESLGVFDLGSTDQTIAVLTGTGTIRNNRSSSGTNILTLRNDTVDSTFSGTILNNSNGTGTLQFIKEGAAKLNLSGANSHSGGTILRGGLTEVIDTKEYVGNVTADRVFGTGSLRFEGGNLAIYADGNGMSGSSGSVQNLAYNNNAVLTENTTVTFGRSTGSSSTWKTLVFGSLTVDAADKTFTVSGANDYTLRFSSLTLNHDVTFNITSSSGHLTINGSTSGAGKHIEKLGSGKLTLNGGTLGSYQASSGNLDIFLTSTFDSATFNGSANFSTHSGNTTTFNVLNYHTTGSSNWYAASGSALYTIGELNMSSGTLRWQNESSSTPDVIAKVVLKGDANITGNSLFQDSGGNGQRILDLDGGERNFVVSTGATLTNQIHVTNGGLHKSGSGTLILSNSKNDYASGTRVTGGTLEVTNTSGSATGTGSVIVTTATLSGNGYIAPSSGEKVTIGTSGILAPGTSSTAIGKLTVSGDIEFLAGANLEERSILSLQIGGKSVGQYDVLDTSGFLDFGGIVQVSLANGFNAATLTAGDSFDFLNWGTSSFANFSNDFDLPNLASYNLGWDTTQFTNTGVISIIQIPEPSRLLLIGLSLGCILLRRKASIPV